jgi:hypothetical protein
VKFSTTTLSPWFYLSDHFHRYLGGTGGFDTALEDVESAVRSRNRTHWYRSHVYVAFRNV